MSINLLIKLTKFALIGVLAFPMLGLAATAPVDVNVVAIAKQDVPTNIEALGQLDAIKQVVLSPQTSGQISSINFKNGSDVVKGEPVVQLSDSIAKTDYAKAKTSLALSQQKYQRAQKIAKYISSQDLATMAADVKTQQAGLNSAFAAMQQRKVIAPFSGRLGAFKFNEGDYIAAGADLVDLVNTDVMRVDYSLPGKLITQLKKGQTVTLHIAQYPHRVFYGTVDYIAPVIDTDTRTVELHALVTNSNVKLNAKDTPHKLLAPGMLATVDHQLAVQHNALMVPEMAVSTDIKGNYVYKVDHNHVDKTYVVEGQHLNGLIQIKSGLSFGDVVVTAGQQKLEDHALIKILKHT
jgi:RND family efflux transporter MFP subunit